ncbi:MAG: DMT family transporter, partial [Rhodobacteraceae bacterium]|nr:DMT family transporter [Paracoccaceae bacterium]
MAQMTAEGGPANRVMLAAGLVLIAMAMLGYVDNFVRVIAEGSGLWQFHLMRSLMAFPLIVLAGAVLGQTLWPRRWGRVIVRSLANSAAMFLYFGALAFLPIGQVVAGIFTAPIFVVLISVLALGHRIGPWRVAAVLIGFAGVIIMQDIDGSRLSVLSLVPVLAGFFYATANVLTREWCAGESTMTLILGFFAAMAIWGLVGIGVLAFWPQVVPAGADGFILRGWTAPSSAVLFWTA